ncbi:MAG: MFS transporter, partial [Desulfococcus multivorans]|nr:MFS transporter [Desulfococcus multivorans]
KKILGIIFFSIFTAVTGVGIVVPLLPVYAHDLGAKGIYIGLLFASFSLSRTFFLPFFGRRSDRCGRKPLIVSGLFCYGLISFAFIAAANVELLIAIRFVQGIASAMIMPATQAYVGDITPENREGFTMGLFNMSTFIGLSLGPFLGGLLNDHFSLDAAFVSMGVLSFIGFFLSLLMLPPAATEQVIVRREAPVAFRTLLKDPYVEAIFVFRMAYTACIGAIWGFLPVFADAEFSLSSSSIGILVMLGIFTSGILQTPMGIIADRWNKRLMILLGGGIVAYSMVLFQWSWGFWDLLTASVVFGIGGSMGMAPLMAVTVQKGARIRGMGAMMSLVTVAHSLGMMLGSLLAGIMMDLVEMRYVFTSSGGVMALGTVVFFVRTLERKKREVSD